MKKDNNTLSIFDDYPDVVTIHDVQKMLRISRHAAYDLIHDGTIPSRRLGRVYRILKSDVIDFMSGSMDTLPSRD